MRQRLTLNIETGNAAFEEAGEAFELARILRKAADKIESGYTEFKLLDSNGNSVGRVDLDPIIED